jgi:hypothetical protein
MAEAAVPVAAFNPQDYLDTGGNAGGVKAPETPPILAAVKPTHGSTPQTPESIQLANAGKGSRASGSMDPPPSAKKTRTNVAAGSPASVRSSEAGTDVENVDKDSLVDCKFGCGIRQRPMRAMMNCGSDQNPTWGCKPCGNSNQSATRRKRLEENYGKYCAEMTQAEFYQEVVRGRVRENKHDPDEPGVGSWGERVKCSATHRTRTEQQIALKDTALVKHCNRGAFGANLKNEWGIEDTNQIQAMWDAAMANPSVPKDGTKENPVIAVVQPRITAVQKIRLTSSGVETGSNLRNRDDEIKAFTAMQYLANSGVTDQNFAGAGAEVLASGAHCNPGNPTGQSVVTLVTDNRREASGQPPALPRSLLPPAKVIPLPPRSLGRKFSDEANPKAGGSKRQKKVTVESTIADKRAEALRIMARLKSSHGLKKTNLGKTFLDLVGKMRKSGGGAHDIAATEAKAQEYVATLAKVEQFKLTVVPMFSVGNVGEHMATLDGYGDTLESLTSELEEAIIQLKSSADTGKKKVTANKRSLAKTLAKAAATYASNDMPRAFWKLLMDVGWLRVNLGDEAQADTSILANPQPDFESTAQEVASTLVNPANYWAEPRIFKSSYLQSSACPVAKITLEGQFAGMIKENVDIVLAVMTKRNVKVMDCVLKTMEQVKVMDNDSWLPESMRSAGIVLDNLRTFATPLVRTLSPANSLTFNASANWLGFPFFYSCLRGDVFLVTWKLKRAL